MRIQGVTGGLVAAGVATLVLVVGVGRASGQDRGAAFGLKGGVSFATFRANGELDTGDNVFAPGSRTGFVGGVFVAIAAGESVLVQPEVLFTQKGARYAAQGNELVYQIDYLEVPLLLKARIGSGATRVALFAGPAAGFKLDAKIVSRTADGEESTNDTVSDQLRSVDWGLVFGGGLDIAAGEGTLTLEGRYRLGLSNLGRDPEPGETTSGFNPKSGVLSLQLGYAF
jgi:hypothetical protein